MISLNWHYMVALGVRPGNFGRSQPGLCSLFTGGAQHHQSARRFCGLGRSIQRRSAHYVASCRRQTNVHLWRKADI